MYKEKFAGYVLLLAWSKEAVCATIKAYVNVASFLALTVSFPKTKLMVIDFALCEDN